MLWDLSLGKSDSIINAKFISQGFQRKQNQQNHQDGGREPNGSAGTIYKLTVCQLPSREI